MKEEDIDSCFHVLGLFLLMLLLCIGAFKIALWAGTIMVLYFIFYISILLKTFE